MAADQRSRFSPLSAWGVLTVLPAPAAVPHPPATEPSSGPSCDEIIKIFEPWEINIVVAGGETQGA